MTLGKKSAKPSKEPKDVRYIRKLFGANARTFTTAGGGFVPFPIIYRKLFRKLTPPQLRVLVYLCTRASKYCLCYPTYEEIAHDLGLGGRKNLTPHIKALEKNGFISTRTSEGKKFYLIHDPRVPIEQLFVQKELTEDDLDEINDLLETLKQPALSVADLRRKVKGTKAAVKP
jgi:DNA-binding MarR family transcriptional regulator